jgi:hypothetical protein
MNAPLVEMIKQALIGINSSKKIAGRFASYGYLLNQCVRQYVIPQSNIHVTKAAAKLWEDLGLSKDDILKIEYRDTIIPQITCYNVNTYRGVKKYGIEPLEVEAGKKRPYNSLFIDEHTTPVSDVIKALKSKCGNNPCEEDIIEVLDKIHITKMLRMENHSLSPTSGRITPQEYNGSGPEDILDVIRGKCRCFDTAGYPELEF